MTADGTNISIFEFTNQPNLHEYLVRHHQKHDKSVDIPHRQDKISWDTLTKMSLQVSLDRKHFLISKCFVFLCVFFQKKIEQ